MGRRGGDIESVLGEWAALPNGGGTQALATLALYPSRVIIL
jgi:hypothetical protein